MKGKTDAITVTIRHCDADTAIQFNICQKETGVIKDTLLLLNSNYRWFSETGRNEIFEAIGVYAALVMESEKYTGLNAILQLECYKIVKGELVVYREGMIYAKRKGAFRKIKLDKYGFVTFL